MKPVRYVAKLKFLEKAASGVLYNVWTVQHHKDVFEIVAIRQLEFTPNSISTVWIEDRVEGATTYRVRGQVYHHKMSAHVIIKRFN